MFEETMVEAVVAHDEAKDVFEAFCNEKLAIDARISKKDDSNDAIVAGFRNENDMKLVIGKLDNKFPGKIGWR